MIIKGDKLGRSLERGSTAEIELLAIGIQATIFVRRPWDAG